MPLPYLDISVARFVLEASWITAMIRKGIPAHIALVIFDNFKTTLFTRAALALIEHGHAIDNAVNKTSTVRSILEDTFAAIDTTSFDIAGIDKQINANFDSIAAKLEQWDKRN